MRQGPTLYKPLTNPAGVDYHSEGRREPVALLEIPAGVIVQQCPPGPEPYWAGYYWPEVHMGRLVGGLYDPANGRLNPGTNVARASSVDE